MFRFLEDSAGNLSSKRLLGSVLLFFGIILSLVLFFYSLEHTATDAHTARNIIDMLLIAGSSLLGISVFERIAK